VDGSEDTLYYCAEFGLSSKNLYGDRAAGERQISLRPGVAAASSATTMTLNHPRGSRFSTGEERRTFGDSCSIDGQFSAFPAEL
jgi:hypothetical protein